MGDNNRDEAELGWFQESQEGQVGKGPWSLSLGKGDMSHLQLPTDKCTSSFPEEIITPNYYY